MNRRIAIIGAGWAGCAAAVTAVKQECHVTVFEASHIPGGRARKTMLEGKTVDNGQHILLGAYRQTLAMMREVGIDPETALVSLPLQMHYPPIPPLMQFEVPRWPAPLNLLAGLLGAKGLDWQDRLALARFFTICRAIRSPGHRGRPAAYPAARTVRAVSQTLCPALASVVSGRTEYAARKCVRPCFHGGSERQYRQTPERFRHAGSGNRSFRPFS